MSAGTLTLTNNSAAVTGSGTFFSTELAAGDFIVVTVGGVPYTLPVKTVNSNTSLTLVSNYTGPTQSGAAWSAVPRVALNMVTAALVAQSSEALRGLNYDKQNWQSIFSSASDDVTVTLPDLSQFTGPSWLRIKKLLEESDIEAIKPIAAQVSSDAKQVAADKNTAANAATTATNKANEASTSASSANTAKTAAESARTTAQQAATNASGSAANAKNDADRAERAADSIDTEVLEKKIDGKADKVDGAVPINQGGTGSTSASGARTGLGLGDVAVMNYNTHVRGGIPNKGQDAASFAAAIQGWSRIGSLTTDSPDGLTWGNMYTVCSAGLRAGNADQSQAGWYWKQIYYSNIGNNIFHRTKVSTGNWSIWYQLTQSSVSDEALKNKGDPLDLEEALSNVNAMDFLHFTYKFDEKNTPRRGVISQQIMGIDPQYVKKVGEYYHLDETPMLLDGLAAIKALRKRDEDNKLRIQELESGIEELKRAVRELAESAS